jgi:hypothetical protein
MDLEQAAKALYIYNEGGGTDPELAEAMWMLDECVQKFWLLQVEVVVEALGLS